MGEVAVVVFLLDGWALAKKKIGKLGFDFEMKRDNDNQFGV